ncbi:hypothetical protein Tco_0752089 [Tanacetum coccineum]|uniref:Uncharacterized protein n=1 Tax=Tanacetum coccineum TaxID=301880 RepID=A0ABQ4Z9F3_9ASTR
MAEVLINALDAGNPLFLKNNDHYNVPIIGFKLIGTENYKMLSTAIKIALTEAFNVVSREESHRGLHPRSGSDSRNKVHPAAFVVKSNNYRGSDFKKGNNNNSSNKGLNSNLLCKNCGLIGHTIERCYEIIGYPTEAQKSASTSSGSTTFDTPFTKYQMMKILSLINEKPSGSANANMAGMRPTFFNENAFFNLHFEKFFCTQTCSYMYNLSVGWIIDLLANQHLIDSAKNMFNVTDISSLNLTVGHLNDTLAKISAIGNLRLTANVVLFDVLVVHEFNIVGLSNSAFVCHVSKQLWHNRLGHPVEQVLSILRDHVHLDL